MLRRLRPPIRPRLAIPIGVSLIVLLGVTYVFFDQLQSNGLVFAPKSNSASPGSAIERQAGLLLVGLWQEGKNNYRALLQQTLTRLKDNNGFNFLLISLDPQMCTEQDTRTSSMEVKRFHVHCTTLDDMTTTSVAAMCATWNCSLSQADEVRSILETRFDSHQRALTLRPLMPVIFGDLFLDAFPHLHITHWFRIDLDMLVDDWANLFPESALNYDLITFRTGGRMFDWSQGIWLKGYLTGFRNSERVNQMWSTIRGFESAAAFKASFASRQRHSGWQEAIDEGAMSVAYMQKASALDGKTLSWIVLPDLVFSDAVLLRDGDHLFKTAIRSDGIVFVDYNASLASIQAVFEAPILANEPNVPVGRLRLHQDCPKMDWLVESDRICLTRQDVDAALLSLLKTNTRLQYSAERRALSRDGKVEVLVSTYTHTQGESGFRLLALHVQKSKEANDFWQHELPDNGVLTIKNNFPFKSLDLEILHADGRAELWTQFANP